MSGIFNADIFGDIFNGGEEYVGQVIFVSGDSETWQDYLKAISDRRTLQYALQEQKKELAAVQRKIVTANSKVKKAEHPEGILANLFRLEQKKDELVVKVRALKVKVEPLDWLIESFKQSEIDDDDEEMMTLH